MPSYDRYGPYSRTDTRSWTPYAYGTDYYADGRKFDRKSSQTFKRSEFVNFGSSSITWREIIAGGGNATTSMAGKRYSAKFAMDGMYSFQQIGVPGRWGRSHGSFAGLNLFWIEPASIPFTVADNQALSRLLKSYIDARTKCRGGNILAEFRDTVRLFRHPVKSLFGALQHFVRNVRSIRGLRNGSKQYAKLLGGYWLLYSFAIKPLMADVADVNKALVSLASRHGIFETIPIKGSGQDEATLGSSIGRQGTLTIPDYSGAVYDAFFLTKASVRYNGAIRARASDFGGLPEHFGVDIYDILPAVWEAIPWSFLIDYFVNVGEMLDAMRLASADLAWLKRSTKTWATVKSTGMYRSLPQNSGGFNSSVGGGAFVSDMIQVNRSPIYNFPAPSFRFTIPGLDSNKWINVAALASQIEGTRPRR